MTRTQAIAEAAKALGLTERYTASAYVTIRHHLNFDTIEAHSFGAACDIAKNWAHELICGDGEHPEGDEVVFISKNEEWGNEEIEIDCRHDGEPFSWVAVEIVKRLAEADTDEKRQHLIVKAREACDVPSVTDQVTEWSEFLEEAR